MVIIPSTQGNVDELPFGGVSKDMYFEDDMLWGDGAGSKFNTWNSREL